MGILTDQWSEGPPPGAFPVRGHRGVVALEKTPTPFAVAKLDHVAEMQRLEREILETVDLDVFHALDAESRRSMAVMNGISQDLNADRVLRSNLRVRIENGERTYKDNPTGTAAALAEDKMALADAEERIARLERELAEIDADSSTVRALAGRCKSYLTAIGLLGTPQERMAKLAENARGAQ